MCFLWFYEHVFECFCQRITRNYRNNVLTKWPCFLIKSRKYFKIQIHQNNFQHKYVQYMQEEVLARGATTSSIFFFLGNILKISSKYKYFQYCDETSRSCVC